MVAPEEYFYYLRKSFEKHHVHGYMIGKKKNHCVCIYEENGKWIVSTVIKDIPVNPKEYDIRALWKACEDIIARFAKSEERRKRIWMDWASPTNWAEKMDIPPLAISITINEYHKLVKEGKI